MRIWSRTQFIYVLVKQVSYVAITCDVIPKLSLIIEHSIFIQQYTVIILHLELIRPTVDTTNF